MIRDINKFDNPVLFIVAGVDGFESVSSTANVAVCILIGFHVSHFLSKGSHGGPSLHDEDEASSCELIPLMRRSAGFSEVGQCSAMKWQ